MTEKPSPTSTTAKETNKTREYSYVRLAMRNMVRKRNTSLKHFFLTVIGLLTFLVGISYLTR
ncbi:MAG: DUF3285 domain-containing protein [Geminocystis sp.]|nr:DUF3285 domain-containing protein [Geminocystis sp.]MCX8078726.1 DUF3285 domain-containing protein [Geminocystis sp.]MDW8117013.1 DUF3285 domain-containing protein [Geminocystis sp.]MDW8462448.1 DUF3285 domain-containing protein [Geminocystis sp.]HIK36645.1 DUF3285 domain-containing protein [Geminocystis sp. M7585_C2015_104]